MNYVLTRRSLIALTAALPLGVAALPLLPLEASAAAAPGPQPAADLDELLAGMVEQGLTGVALLVEQGGKPLYSGAAGMARIEDQTPLRTDDRFPIYSIAKTFTATVALQLVDEGVLTLDDTVAEWLDDPVVERIPYTDEMTLHQLLNHTSGVYDYADEDSPFWQDAFFGPNADPTREWTPQELLAYADGAKHDPYFAPGEGYHYANTDYFLVGLMIEAATGNRLADEIRSRILDPLGLADTAMVGDESATGEHVDGYHLIEGQLVNVSAINLSWAWAAGGMVSTTSDLARFAEAVYSGELLSPESFAAMFTFVPGAKPGQEAGLGLYTLETPNGKLVGMDGSGAGFNSSMMRLPDADLVVTLLINKGPDEGEPDTIRDAAFAWALAGAPGTPAASSPPSRSGA
jgi:CubicO group peptidase (beta-lactamase class C family)